MLQTQDHTVNREIYSSRTIYDSNVQRKLPTKMETLRDNKIRVAYSIISAIIIWLAYEYKLEIVKSPDKFNDFSYVGGVATLIGLLIAVSEVIHAVRISKSIQEEAAALISHAKTIDLAALTSECLSSLDETNDHVSGERYLTALKCFQYFRRTHLRVPSSAEVPDGIIAIIREVEIALQSSTHATVNAPLTKRQRLNIQGKIMTIKSSLEKISPVAGGAYVS